MAEVADAPRCSGYYVAIKFVCEKYAMTIQYSDMSQSEINEFLQVPRHAVVATNRVNGPPQLTPVWYLYENEKIYISMFVESAKFKNLHRDPRVSICIAGESPDARAVIFSGTVDLFLEDSAMWDDEIIWRLVRRYFDSDKEAQLYMDSEDNLAESALAVVSPERIIAQDYN